jgi:hypothetical protein
VAGALFYAAAIPARGQSAPPPSSTVPIPVKPKTDSTPDSLKVKRDSIKAPIGRFADPATYEIGAQYEWNREQLFATGALTVTDLLDRIPGATTYRSGWLATPQTTTFNADFRRVRIFYDGVEMDALDNTTGGLLDLSTVQIWTLEHLTIERTASELRLYLRTWRVDNTDPYTRVDVATGNEDTNLYRGFYGKRFDNGGVLQLAGQQFGVTSPRFAGAGDNLSLLARVGIARKSWSVDGFVNRTHATRDIERTIASSGRPPILALDATHTNAYVRAAVGRVGSGPWIQATAASLGFKGTTDPDRSVGATSQPDTLPRKVTETQYNVSAGFTLGPARVEVQDRLRALEGTSYNSASGRLDLVTSFAVLSGFAEHDGFRQITNLDAGIRLQPLPFIAVAGSIGRVTPGSQSNPNLGIGSFATGTSVRGEVALKVFGPWVSAGILSTDTARGPAPVVYDTLLLPTIAGRRRAGTAAIRGPLGRGFGIDAWITRWDSTSPYQPQYQSRAEINFANNFAKRFPRGDLDIRAAVIYEYRGHNIFPLAAGDLRTMAAKTLSAQLEIRILRAVVSYQQRNILAYQYQVIPGFEMPRVLAIYGVRWEFWN